MPAAKRSGLAPEDSVKPVNAVIMPTTVPRRPSNGLTVAIVPSIDNLLSRLYLTSKAFSSIFDSIIPFAIFNIPPFVLLFSLTYILNSNIEEGDTPSTPVVDNPSGA